MDAVDSSTASASTSDDLPASSVTTQPRTAAWPLDPGRRDALVCGDSGLGGSLEALAQLAGAGCAAGRQGVVGLLRVRGGLLQLCLGCDTQLFERLAHAVDAWRGLVQRVFQRDGLVPCLVEQPIGDLVAEHLAHLLDAATQAVDRGLTICGVDRLGERYGEHAAGVDAIGFELV
ncbi:hypothetical protein GO496_04595 [Acidovorax citrulli]|nr:hypothetical protein [Paracidovorax citrulli]